MKYVLKALTDEELDQYSKSVSVERARRLVLEIRALRAQLSAAEEQLDGLKSLVGVREEELRLCQERAEDRLTDIKLLHANWEAEAARGDRLAADEKAAQEDLFKAEWWARRWKEAAKLWRRVAEGDTETFAALEDELNDLAAMLADAQAEIERLRR